MKVSLNIIRELTGLELPPVDELVTRVNAQLGGVEEVIDLSVKYAGPVIVKVVECEPHPDSDHMHVCRVDDGGVTADVERSEDGLVQVVCGAPNAHTGMLAAWLPPGSTVPSSYDEKELFVLGSRELRGVMSHGMLASPRELALGDDHDGILDIDPNEVNSLGEKPTIGVKFAVHYGLDDVILDIENKMFTHRPDLFGQLGVAREISAILLGLPAADEDVADARFKNPDWYWLQPEYKVANKLELTVYNDAVEKVPRFMAVVMQGVKVEPSPLWLRAALVRLGSKPINNVVDATNYIMLMTAQPTHAYDYDKLHGHKLGVRMAAKNEKVTLLNGKSYELTEDDIVITDGAGAVGLGGVMGGFDSEVSNQTTAVVLECATFDMYTVRKTSMRYGLFTDAVTRFNKGQSHLQNHHVMAKLTALITDLTNATQASPVADLPDKSSRPLDVSLSGEMRVSTGFINSRLGSNLTTEQIGGLLRRVNFASYPTEDDTEMLVITAPFWRTDIDEPEDIVEEVGRLYGFDKLPRELPRRSIMPASKNARLETKLKITQVLSEAGANEVKTYSFVHENLLKKTGQDIELAFRLSNALSPDLQYYRLSLTPSLLDKIHMNSKAGHDEFAIFETGKVHGKSEVGDDGLPRELGRVAGIYTAKRPASTAYFTAKRYARLVLGSYELDGTVEYIPLAQYDAGGHKLFMQMTAPYDPARAAVLLAAGSPLGVVGEFKRSVIKNLKLPEATAGFELFLSPLGKTKQTYVPLSRFPSVTQDISLKVAAEVPASLLQTAAERSLGAVLPGSMVSSLDITDIYQRAGEPTKTITMRLKVSNYDRTLTDQEVQGYLETIAADTGKELHAVLV